MTRSRIQLGQAAEQLVYDYLVSRGWTILERNWRTGHLEIDLIAKDGRNLIFIEVKAGKSNSFGLPEERVHSRKQKRLIEAALTYIQMQNPEATEIRWDVISVEYRKGKPMINHLVNAFTADQPG